VSLQEWCGREAVVFDLDGTLVDTLPDLTLALNRALADLGLHEIDIDLVAKSLHGGLEGSVDAALTHQAADPALRGELLRRYEEHYALDVSRGSRAFPDAEEVLVRLRRRGAGWPSARTNHRN
jgi:phosphoglycolate phosphatase